MSHTPRPAPHRTRSSRSSLLQPHAVVPLVVAGIFAIVAPAAWLRFSNFDGSTCPSALKPDNLWPTGAFVAVISAFLLGGFLGKLAREPSATKSTTALKLAQVGLTGFMGALTVAWWYETRALADPNLHPITYYIMCIKNTQNDWTLVVFMVGALIAGRWLWHRSGAYF